jgi:hypothetical protein
MMNDDDNGFVSAREMCQWKYSEKKTNVVFFLKKTKQHNLVFLADYLIDWLHSRPCDVIRHGVMNE